MLSPLRQLASLVSRRPRRVVAIVVAFALVAAALGGNVADRLDSYGADDPATESIRAEARLADAGANAEVNALVLTRSPSGVLSPSQMMVA